MNQHPSTSNTAIKGVSPGPELFITFFLVRQEKKNVLAFQYLNGDYLHRALLSPEVELFLVDLGRQVLLVTVDLISPSAHQSTVCILSIIHSVTWYRQPLN